MTPSQSRPALGGVLYMVLAFTLGGYFTFAAVQGDYGVFRRVQIGAEAEELRSERQKLQDELAGLTNLTQRLSDDYLDLDLLDERARDVLGYMRPDELLIR
jgi:cell division protein FtsB